MSQGKYVTHNCIVYNIARQTYRSLFLSSMSDRTAVTLCPCKQSRVALRHSARLYCPGYFAPWLNEEPLYNHRMILHRQCHQRVHYTRAVYGLSFNGDLCIMAVICKQRLLTYVHTRCLFFKLIIKQSEKKNFRKSLFLMFQCKLFNIWRGDNLHHCVLCD